MVCIQIGKDLKSENMKSHKMNRLINVLKLEIGQVYFFIQDYIDLPGLDQEKLNFTLRIMLVNLG